MNPTMNQPENQPEEKPAFSVTYTVEVFEGHPSGAALYINGQLMSFFQGALNIPPHPDFFMADLWAYLRQQKEDAKKIEPKRFARMMKRMLRVKP